MIRLPRPMNPSGRAQYPSLAQLNLRYPALPQTFLRIMEVMERGSSSDADAVCEAILHDPGAVARVLRLANSAAQGPDDEVRTVSRAVEVLGADTVAGVILSMNMAELRSTLDVTTTLPFLDLIRHSVATGFLARYLFLMHPQTPRDAATRQERGQEMYTAGLLHDFGKLLLLYTYPEEASRFYGAMVRDFTSDFAVLEAERVLFGFNHAEAGSYLSRQLRFPAFLTHVIGLHHTYTNLDTLPWHLRHRVYQVAAANRLAHALEDDAPSNTLEMCFRDDVWRLLIQEGAVGVDSLQVLIGELAELRPQLGDYLNTYV